MTHMNSEAAHAENQARLRALEKQVLDFNAKLEEIADQTHLIKHDYAQVRNNSEGTFKLFQEMKPILTNIHETLLSSRYEPRIAENERFKQDMLNMLSIDGWKQLIKDSQENTTHRIKTSFLWPVITGVLGLISGILAVLKWAQ